jgi:hypothetical protein
MKPNIEQLVSDLEQRIDLYSVEQLESRFEMLSLGNSQCTSNCGSDSSATPGK